MTRVEELRPQVVEEIKIHKKEDVDGHPHKLQTQPEPCFHHTMVASIEKMYLKYVTLRAKAVRKCPTSAFTKPLR